MNNCAHHSTCAHGKEELRERLTIRIDLGGSRSDERFGRRCGDRRDFRRGRCRLGSGPNRSFVHRDCGHTLRNGHRVRNTGVTTYGEDRRTTSFLVHRQRFLCRKEGRRYIRHGSGRAGRRRRCLLRIRDGNGDPLRLCDRYVRGRGHCGGLHGLWWLMCVGRVSERIRIDRGSTYTFCRHVNDR